MDAFRSACQAVVWAALAVFLATITLTCAAMFATACWDILHSRRPLQLPHVRDEVAEHRARRQHPTHGRAG